MTLKQILSIGIGSFIRLSDEVSLLLSSANGNGVKPLDYEVQALLGVSEPQKWADWVFITLKGTYKNLTLMCKIVDGEKDFFILEDAGLPKENRAAYLRKEQFWLFHEPQGEWEPNDLKYTTTFPEETEDKKNFTYVIKNHGERSGGAQHIPGIQGLPNLIATVAEYTAEEDASREAVILEVGAVDSDEGGIITLFTGRRINSHEVEFFTK